MLRKEIVRLTDIVAIVRKHVGVVDLRNCCQCPFHRGPSPTMRLFADRASYSCDVCGEQGDVVNLLMKLHGWSYKRAFEHLVIQLRDQPIGTVYVLALEHHCYYVGYTLDLVKRMEQHFNKQGSDWTKLHRPVKLVDAYHEVSYAMENVVTRLYRRRFGSYRVRGGSYINF